MSAPPAGNWSPDPTGRHELRWHDGSAFTDQVADGGVTGVDPYDPASASAPAPAVGAPGGRSKAPVLVGVVVVLVLVGAGVVVFGGGDDGLSD